jgi:hypothetical protein
MGTLERFAVAALVAAAVGVGGFAGVPTASAMMRTCAEALKLHDIYMTHARVALAVGHSQMASYWAGRATGVLEGAC